MKESLSKLLSVGSQTLGGSCIDQVDFFSSVGKARGDELKAMLMQKNGFYAFAGALHVLPSTQRYSDSGVTLETWNSPDLWRSGYGLTGTDIAFFAEDLFGVQFCIHGDEVLSFDPETAGFSYLASSIEEWADKILSDYDYLTGYSLAHGWQMKNGALKQGDRLLPKQPFVLGGKFKIENLYACESVSGMKVRSELATKIKDLPDGAELRFEFGE
ncbi:SMI1/KNR4 family protein [Pseudomonas sp. NPDC089401]|uniref:SMI1/KNR4 family protein n=1 Tax=Pseudomonas sp. NPDC089401 TaxID=3364462 RepID=UPI00380833C6